MREDVYKLFISKYKSMGEDRFYRFLLSYAMDKIANFEKKDISPEVELIGYYEKFLQLYRREGEIDYLELAKIFRKAGNKIYRVLLKTNSINKNNKFLNVV